MYKYGPMYNRLLTHMYIYTHEDVSKYVCVYIYICYMYTHTSMHSCKSVELLEGLQKGLKTLASSTDMLTGCNCRLGSQFAPCG